MGIYDHDHDYIPVEAFQLNIRLIQGYASRWNYKEIKDVNIV